MWPCAKGKMALQRSVDIETVGVFPLRAVMIGRTKALIKILKSLSLLKIILSY